MGRRMPRAVLADLDRPSISFLIRWLVWYALLSLTVCTIRIYLVSNGIRRGPLPCKVLLRLTMTVLFLNNLAVTYITVDIFENRSVCRLSCRSSIAVFIHNYYWWRCIVSIPLDKSELICSIPGMVPRRLSRINVESWAISATRSLAILWSSEVLILQFLLHESLSICPPLYLIDWVFQNSRIVEEFTTTSLKCDNLFVKAAFIELLRALSCLFVLRRASETAWAMLLTLRDGIHNLITII